MNLIDQYKAMHEDEANFLGITIGKHADLLNHLIKRYNITDALDYGCGKALAYSKYNLHQKWDITVGLYDPGVEKFNKKPLRTFDAVFCIDVAEHIEESSIDNFLDDVIGYAEKMVFLTICTRASSKILPDGRNSHVTIKPIDWWLAKLNERNTKGKFIHVRLTD